MSRQKKSPKKPSARNSREALKGFHFDPRRTEHPTLRFSPTAWAKLLFFRDRGNTEIGGFGICAKDDLLHVEDLVTVKQEVTGATVSFDDDAVADFFEAQVDAGRRPEQFGRAWLHTHPGESAEPSNVDEETFQRVFGSCEWAVMFILGRTGKTSARLQLNIGPKGHVRIPVEVDYAKPFGPSDHDAWQEEYNANIKVVQHALRGWDEIEFDEDDWRSHVPPEWRDELEAMAPEERGQILAELSGQFDIPSGTETLYGYYGY